MRRALSTIDMDAKDRTEHWSAPDAEGLACLRPGDPRRATLRDRRHWRAVRPQPLAADTWPSEWRAMVSAWVARRGEGPVRRDVLLKSAGAARAHDMDRVIDLLLRAGLIETEERFERGSWWLHAVRFTGAPALRSALGLPEPDHARQIWAGRRDTRFDDAELDAAVDALDAEPPARALSRLALLESLARWSAEGRSGTWRDFAQFARGDTKAVTGSEREWLNAATDLARRGIEDHTPLLRLRAPLRLHSSAGVLDLGAAGDFIGLSPRTLEHSRVEGKPACWRLVENLSSFERVARSAAADEAVLWLPGYPPSWWLQAIRTLLAAAPAPCFIACDPDPDGIAIALHAARIWQEKGLVWSPWHMSAEDLAGLSVRRSLTARDREKLLLLRSQGLPPTLDALAGAMLASGEKGEQEALL
ncbi:DUF2399 domain-containing protein [Methyloversatilis thermotolerans]|uniref:DUF2399 domain-containing protein n=1 Tax=Methyloversatilis thermotolerans TaxID=1346290 RepID=UPI00058FFB00|nr:DUF2399 domain-containing protein [Methyloversatilis thermotolerans]